MGPDTGDTGLDERRVNYKLAHLHLAISVVAPLASVAGPIPEPGHVGPWGMSQEEQPAAEQAAHDWRRRNGKAKHGSHPDSSRHMDRHSAAQRRRDAEEKLQRHLQEAKNKTAPPKTEN